VVLSARGAFGNGAFFSSTTFCGNAADSMDAEGFKGGVSGVGRDIGFDAGGFAASSAVENARLERACEGSGACLTGRATVNAEGNGLFALCFFDINPPFSISVKKGR